MASYTTTPCGKMWCQYIPKEQKKPTKLPKYLGTYRPASPARSTKMKLPRRLPTQIGFFQ